MTDICTLHCFERAARDAALCDEYMIHEAMLTVLLHPHITITYIQNMIVYQR